tara:strand:- start:660 stop:893 length:234 start_codon:yes stop_codon:yes gene_type:complete
MKHTKEELESENEIIVERIKSAVSAGVKIKKISNSSSITYFRIASVVNVESYRYKTSFTMEEISRIHKALDFIKSAL